MHHEIYHKPDFIRNELIRLMGEGVLVTEGDKHRNQRRLMNPAFGPGILFNLIYHPSISTPFTSAGQVRDLTGIFLDKANEVSVEHLDPASDPHSFSCSSGRSGTPRLAPKHLRLLTEALP
jgi:hypothetical protein